GSVLEEVHMCEKTVWVVISDLVDILRENGLCYKMSPYEESSLVPLIVYGPDHLVPKGRFANPVSLIDLMPTLLELSDAPRVNVAGMSLLESARQEASGDTKPADRDGIIEYMAEGTNASQITLISGQYKYVVCPGDPEQLVDLEIGRAHV